MTKGWPIIFSGKMVRALIEGRKTQTRRLATSPLAKRAVGDLLYVRETFSYGVDILTGAENRKIVLLRDHYATNPIGVKWRPSIHMPRWASALTLEVTGVKTEPLQEISKADVIAEGITERDGCPIDGVVNGWHEPYAALWDSLHGDGSWCTNPRVVVLLFKVRRVNVDRLLEKVSA